MWLTPFFAPPLKVTITFLNGSLFFIIISSSSSLQHQQKVGLGPNNTQCSTLQATAKKQNKTKKTP